MREILILLFFLAALILFYIFFGYPLLLFLISLAKRCPDEPPIPDSLPRVSIVIPAYNEALGIKESIENILNIDYPKDEFELIIVSDASEDGTDTIVSNFPDKRVKLIRLEKRGGAGKAIDAGIRDALFDIVVTSDANAKMDKEMVKNLVGHFRDKNTGGVSGDKVIVSTGEGESVYWKYENAIKNYEYKALGTVLSSDNVSFALRKSIFTDECPPIIGHDFWLSLYIAGKGYKIIYEKNAKVYEEYSPTPEEDFNRKIRVILGGMQAVFLFPRLLFSFRSFSAAFQLWSHKILRWFASIFALFLFAANLPLAKTPFFQITLLCQCAFYSAAVIGILFPATRKNMLIKAISYFVSMNTSSLVAIYYYFIKGQKEKAFWEKARG